MRDQAPGVDWSRTIFDRKGAVLADSALRSADLSAAAEAPKPDDLRADIRSKMSGWVIRVRASPGRLEQSARTDFLVFSVGVVVLLALAVSASFALGTVFARDLERAAGAAHALAQGGPVSLARSAVKEVDVVANAIFDASNALAKRDRDQELLRRELQHRVGNMIAVVQAVVIRLARAGLPPDQLKTTLCERLEALARAQELIVKREWQTVPLREILQQELAGFADDVTIDGPDVLIGGATVQTFALLVHELATNAIKHGAFRSAEGTLLITLGIDGEVFSFLWEEHGAPPVRSSRKGFGTQLLDSVFAHSTTRRRRDVLPTGFVYELHVRADIFGIRRAATERNRDRGAEIGVAEFGVR
jgi:two-component sensor histidine kinase